MSGFERLFEVAVVFLRQIGKPRSMAPCQLASAKDEVGAAPRILPRRIVASAVALTFGHDVQLRQRRRVQRAGAAADLLHGHAELVHDGDQQVGHRRFLGVRQVPAALDVANDLGVTPLWLAANNGSAEVVQALLAGGAAANAGLPSGETPLMTASRAGNAAAVRALLSRGADPHATEHAHGQTAPMWAAAQRHPEVVRALLESGARVDDRSFSYPQVVSSAGNADPSGIFEVQQGGYTPLLFAARQGDLASARLLVEAGADVNEAAASGTTPLVVAAHSGHGELAAYLLDAGADPDAAGAGYTALHAAVLRGDQELVQALLTHGANPDAVLARGTPARRVSADWRLPHRMIGATPFWAAAWFREPRLVHLLAEHGADPLASVGGETAVMAAIRGRFSRGRFGVVRPPAEVERRNAIDAATEAIDAGADVNGRSENGDTALHMAVSQRLDGVIALLAERGASSTCAIGRARRRWVWRWPTQTARMRPATVR